METISIFDLGIQEPIHIQTHKKIFKSGEKIEMCETFSGIGCQRMGLNLLSVKHDIVGISEIDKYAIQSYMAMHGDTPNYGDITKMTYIPQCDIFTYSFPCTDLSKVGKQKGLSIGTRSGLLWEITRLLQATEKKPLVLVMENVVDLIQKKFKRGFEELFMILESMDYKNFVKVLNSKDFGVAQNRARVFMVSILRTKNNPDPQYEFPIPFQLKTRLKDYLEPLVDEKYYVSESKISHMKKTQFRTGNYDSIVSSGDDICPTLCARDYKDPKCVLESKNNEIKPGIIVVGQTSNDSSQGGKIYNSEGIAPTLCAGNHGYAMGYIEDPSIIVVAQLAGKHEESGRVYSKEGLSPTINTMGGGNRQPKIAEPICINPKIDGKQPSIQDRIYDADGISTAITTGFMPSILIPEATKKGFAEAHDGDGVYINRPHQKRGVVQKGMIQTLKTSCDDVGVVVYSDTTQKHIDKNIIESNEVVGTLTTSCGHVGTDGCYVVKEKLRIRKLTPRECWRLMGISRPLGIYKNGYQLFDDTYFEKASQVCSNSQLYKQAGNGIVVDVFAEVLRGLIE